MKSVFFICLALLFIAFGLAGGNIFSGLNLAQNQFASADNHLIRALGIVLSCLIGSGGVIYASQRLKDQKMRTAVMNNLKPRPVPTQMPFGASILVILLSVLGLISGTISHAGRLPLLHTIFGFGLTFALLMSLIFWIQFYADLKKLS